MLGALIPWWGKLLALVALVGTIWFHGWQTGRGQVREQWEAAAAKLESERLAAVVRAAGVSATVVTKYVDRVRIVRDAASASIGEAHRVAGDCPLSRVAAGLLDAAAVGGDVSFGSGNAVTPPAAAVGAAGGR